MSSATSLTRLAFRPLSSRCQCRHASRLSTPPAPRPSAIGELTKDLLQGDRGRTPLSPRQPVGLASRSPPRSGAKDDGATPPRQPTRLLAIAQARLRAKETQRQEAANRGFTKEELERQSFRMWQGGDLYSPHDLTGVEMGKWKKSMLPKMGKRDVFDQLGINPILQYKNFTMMAEFVSETGRIRPRKETGLRPVNQRRLAKAIKRAAALGLMPRTYKHPELLRREQGSSSKRV